jgi:hypothetical protein
MSRNQRLLTSALLAAGLGVTVSATALAQPGWTGGQYGPGGRGPAPFTAMDADGDGFVSAPEHASFRAQRQAERAASGRLLRNAGNAPRFTDLDVDDDGRLSQTEIGQFRTRRMLQRGYGPQYRRGGPCRGMGRGGCRGRAWYPSWW